MSEEAVSRGLRLVGGGLIVLELAIQQAGFGVSSRVDPLAAALWMSIFGSVLLVGYVLLVEYVRGKGSLGITEFGAEMWVPIVRTAFSNGVIGVAYVIAVAKLGLGVTAAIVALGPLSVGFWGILKSLKDEQRSRRVWAWEQLALRVAAFGGVVMVNQPWHWLDDFSAATLIGLVAAVASAVCFWNYIVCVFGKMDETKTKGGLAVANVLSVPLTVFAVWLTGKFMGGGLQVAFSKDVIVTGVIAGVLAITVPAILQDWATGKVSDRVTGVLYLLDSPIAAFIGVAGVFFGLLSDNQAAGLWVWGGIAIVVLAALRVTLKGDQPKSVIASA
ncbi:hypothetical protein [Actinomadura sp. WMMA1423]|uniref:hypothetical protein n=1 Tax=Actinomadura sp. WMMA1423 TaxID=2591108 RepID=UPI0011473F11|nr:hypothetical protein [Actinomadura sp. WMMA1423]